MRKGLLGVVAGLAVGWAGTATAAAAETLEPLAQFTVRGVSAAELAEAGFDMRESHRTRGGRLIVATATQAAALEAKGGDVRPVGRSSLAAVTAPDPRVDPNHGYDVFRPWSLPPAPCPGTCVTPLKPLKEIYEDQRRANTDVVTRVVYGQSLLGQDLVAYRVTRGGRDWRGRRKPVVLYNAVQHAREWLAAETNRRLFEYVLAHKDDTGTDVPRILRTTELWFVPVVNPDGYDYTFVSPDTRFHRKNLRDNDGDGAITEADGVDLNRNWPTKWRFDPEGASDDFASETYRGTAPASEPEVAAYRALMARLRAKFHIDYHTYGELILYPEGWQVETPATDDPLYTALAGRDEADTAIRDHDPDVAAELYTSNGDITDDSYDAFGSIAYTVELSEGYGGPVGGTDGTDGAYTPAGFAFQDSDAAIETEFRDNLQFALDLARSARDPDDPVSHIGNTAPAFVPTAFATSHGDPQLVEVNAKKALGAVRAHWLVLDTGRRGSRRAREWEGGLRHGGPGTYYHRMRATIATGAAPGQRVRVWFTGARGQRSEAFEYTLASDTGASALIMAAEDYTGRSSLASDSPFAGPSYVDEYEAALDGAGISHDLYDVDATRAAPHWLGVLSHYDAVVWYTGDDVIVRGPGQVRPDGPESGGTTGTERLFDDEVIGAREYLNSGGKLLVTGQQALEGAWLGFLYNPLGATPPNPFCKTNQSLGFDDADDPPGQLDNCVAVSDDFMQYWLGANLPIALATDTPLQEAPPIGSTPFLLDPAGNQQGLRSFVTTSSLLPDYPAFNDAEFGSERAVQTQAGPAFDPPEGEWFAAAAAVDSGYQRLTRTFDLSGVAAGQAADLSFVLSGDTEADYDYVFVEAHTVGQDDYRTLPDLNGNTSEDTGAGCPDESDFWLSENPFLRRYIVRAATPEGFECTPAQPGIWNAASGNSGGFQDWRVGLSAYAGQQVEVSIAYVTDPGTQGFGVFLDRVRATANGAEIHATGFEDETLGGWAVTPAPEGSGANPGDWTRSRSLGLVDGPGVRTGHSILWGFGLEGVQGAAERAALAGNALRHLGARSE